MGCTPKEEFQAIAPVRPLNVRTINDVNLNGLKIKKADGWSTMEPPYEVE